MADDSAPLTPMYAATLLGVTPVFLQTELSRIPVAALNWHPAAGEWCAKEVVGHLSESEQRGFAGRPPPGPTAASSWITIRPSWSGSAPGEAIGGGRDRAET